MKQWKQCLLRCYAQRRAVAWGSFQLTGGGTSDLYIDGRLVTTFPPALRAIVEGMREIVDDRSLLPPGCNLVVPVLSGVPIAVALALALDIPYVMDRGAAKSHGTGKRFEGAFSDSPQCLLVDDLVTVGSTLVRSIEGLREIGKALSDVVVVVDREEGARETLARMGVTLHSLLTKADLLQATRGAADVE